ncbi:MAG: hypothetical protein EB145_07050, partial [Proteobacteria bacterium]|nr:hypothetical protein [Pseudomonadota bacterium]
MNRRDFLHQQATCAASLVAGTAALTGLGTHAHAQAPGDFIEGRDFRRLGTPAPVPGHGKI